MPEFLTDWGLLVITFVPLAGALLMMLIPQENEETHKQVSLLASLLALALGVWYLFDFNYGAAGSLQYVVDENWIDVINSR
ncbi:MAG: NADH-quinone oxidoreductase subunit M, partial [Acidimicrobiaceae bacterium]|nr:NADH-quinone oxidoreductase subunit M [Acidimicrobiaceae bacterium]